jgi:hypothetical protein
LATPAAPTGLIAEPASNGHVELKWTGSQGASTYQVWRNGAHIGTQSALDPTVFVDSTVKASRTYTYQVYALNLAGVRSPPSNPATITTGPPYSTPSPAPAPSLPQCADATSADGNCQLPNPSPDHPYLSWADLAGICRVDYPAGSVLVKRHLPGDPWSYLPKCLTPSGIQGPSIADHCSSYTAHNPYKHSMTRRGAWRFWHCG